MLIGIQINLGVLLGQDAKKKEQALDFFFWINLMEPERNGTRPVVLYSIHENDPAPLSRLLNAFKNRQRPVSPLYFHFRRGVGSHLTKKIWAKGGGG